MAIGGLETWLGFWNLGSRIVRNDWNSNTKYAQHINVTA